MSLPMDQLEEAAMVGLNMDRTIALSSAISLRRIADALNGIPAPGGTYSITEMVERLVTDR